MDNLARLYIDNSQNMDRVEDNSIDFIFTGPPYWTHLKYSNDKGQLGNIYDYELFHQEVAKVWAECFRVLKPGSFLCALVNDLYEHDGDTIIKRIPLMEDFTRYIIQTGFTPANTVFWDSYLQTKNKRLPKENRIASRSRYIVPQRMHYFLFFIKKGNEGFRQAKYNRVLNSYYWQPFWKLMAKKKLMGSTLLYQLAGFIARHLPIEDMMEVSWLRKLRKAVVSNRHQEEKYPVSIDHNVVKKIIKDFTESGDTVLDPFVGSGTTLAVASSLNRKSIGYEINKDAKEIVNHQLSGEVDIFDE